MNYGAIYDRLIDRARGRFIDGYSEKHHVLPRCLGGSDDPDNLVRLTPEEHYVAHQLLVKLHPGHLGLLSAAHVMTANTRGQTANKLYGWLRRRMSVAQTGQKRPPEVGQKIAAKLRGRKQRPEHIDLLASINRGKKLSAKQLQAISAAHKGKKHSPERVEQNRAAHIGKKHSDETKAKMSAAHKGRARPADIGAKISAAKKGKKLSVPAWNKGKKMPPLPPEVIAKRGAAIKAAYAARRAAAVSEPTRVA